MSQRETARVGFVAAAIVATAAITAFFALPVVGILLGSSPRELLAELGDSDSLTAIGLSFGASAVAVGLVVLLGTPAAYLLARRRFKGRAALITLLELPIVMPPAVAGVGLLVAFGPKSLVGGWLERLGISLPFTFAAVVLALAFVSGPFYLRQAQVAFARIDEDVLDAARICGAHEQTVLRLVALPLALPGLAAGATTSFARALGEFGATLMFAGALSGVTQTAPLLVYGRFSQDFDSAVSLSAVLLVFAAALLLASRFFEARFAARVAD